MYTQTVRSFALALFFGMTLTAAAQTNTIRIEEGAVFVNGQRQAAEELPETLELEGLTASLSFSGPARFRMGEYTYSIEGGRLVQAEPSDDAFLIFVGRGDSYLESPRAANPFLMRRLSSTSEPRPLVQGQGGLFDLQGNRVAVTTPQPMRQYFELLDGKLQRMDVLADMPASQAAIRLHQEAREAADVVRAFPQIELQTYLEDVQNRNSGLYDRIVREHLMEMETRRLASRILTTDDSRQKQELQETLHEKLSEIFELKQENRRSEIEELGDRLTELRSQLDARERNKQEIIDRRIRELLGQLN
ncbi:MAG: hypothetical protein JJ896_07775 [Rhodothermales bacterium]|nr:hypothetical protein [Rhodothermales bacterium]MBO6779538.1 hypothetical protein [Rhodothermales bacterium]